MVNLAGLWWHEFGWRDRGPFLCWFQDVLLWIAASHNLDLLLIMMLGSFLQTLTMGNVVHWILFWWTLGSITMYLSLHTDVNGVHLFIRCWWNTKFFAFETLHIQKLYKLFIQTISMRLTALNINLLMLFALRRIASCCLLMYCRNQLLLRHWVFHAFSILIWLLFAVTSLRFIQGLADRGRF